MNLHPIYALVIASLRVPAVALALMADCALAAEMPKDFQGTWCTDSDTSRTIGTRIIPEAQTARTITVLSRSLPRR